MGYLNKEVREELLRAIAKKSPADEIAFWAGLFKKTDKLVAFAQGMASGAAKLKASPVFKSDLDLLLGPRIVYNLIDAARHRSLKGKKLNLLQDSINFSNAVVQTGLNIGIWKLASLGPQAVFLGGPVMMCNALINVYKATKKIEKLIKERESLKVDSRYLQMSKDQRKIAVGMLEIEQARLNKHDPDDVAQLKDIDDELSQLYSVNRIDKKIKLQRINRRASIGFFVCSVAAVALTFCPVTAIVPIIATVSLFFIKSYYKYIYLPKKEISMLNTNEKKSELNSRLVVYTDKKIERNEKKVKAMKKEIETLFDKVTKTNKKSERDQLSKKINSIAKEMTQVVKTLKTFKKVKEKCEQGDANYLSESISTLQRLSGTSRISRIPFLRTSLGKVLAPFKAQKDMKLLFDKRVSNDTVAKKEIKALNKALSKFVRSQKKIIQSKRKACLQSIDSLNKKLSSINDKSFDRTELNRQVKHKFELKKEADLLQTLETKCDSLLNQSLSASGETSKDFQDLIEKVRSLSDKPVSNHKLQAILAPFEQLLSNSLDSPIASVLSHSEEELSSRLDDAEDLSSAPEKPGLS